MVQPALFQRKRLVHQARRHSAEHHRVGRRQPLQAGGDVGRVAHGELLLAVATAHLANDHQPGVEPNAYRHPYPILRFQTRIQGRHGLDKLQTGLHGPLRLVFMGMGVAEVHQEPIARYCAI